jgi:hypothetical protein
MLNGIKNNLPSHLRFEASGETWEKYSQKLTQMGGIVESWIEGTEKRSQVVYLTGNKDK